MVEWARVPKKSTLPWVPGPKLCRVKLPYFTLPWIRKIGLPCFTQYPGQKFCSTLGLKKFTLPYLTQHLWSKKIVPKELSWRSTLYHPHCYALRSTTLRIRALSGYLTLLSSSSWSLLCTNLHKIASAIVSQQKAYIYHLVYKHQHLLNLLKFCLMLIKYSAWSWEKKVP